MSDKYELLELAKNVVREALITLDEEVGGSGLHEFSDVVPREMKAEIDVKLDKQIFNQLKSTSISILSEEAGLQIASSKTSLQWIVDPLDGTVNFIRSLGPAGVSIALWDDAKPIFGVVGEFPSGNIYWGGRAFGSFVNERPISVSPLTDVARAVVCSGFPSRYEFSGERPGELFDRFRQFAKVRMLGAASISIVQVARGNAEVYFESDIMIWDVAAALAIVEGAGGGFVMSRGRFENSYDVYATNSVINLNFEN